MPMPKPDPQTERIEIAAVELFTELYADFHAATEYAAASRAIRPGQEYHPLTIQAGTSAALITPN